MVDLASSAPNLMGVFPMFYSFKTGIFMMAEVAPSNSMRPGL
jgi:hypothetical protein